MNRSDLEHAELVAQIAAQIVDIICRTVAGSAAVAPSQALLVAVLSATEAAATLCLMAGSSARDAACVASEYLLSAVARRSQEQEEVH